MNSKFEKMALKFTEWIGTPASVLVHTLIFVGFLLLILLGFDPEKTLLVLTTGVSLEAIYLSIFIQMTINHSSRVLKDVHEDVSDLQDVIEEEFEVEEAEESL